jgi:hypothetical protein
MVRRQVKYKWKNRDAEMERKNRMREFSKRMRELWGIKQDVSPLLVYMENVSNYIKQMSGISPKMLGEKDDRSFSSSLAIVGEEQRALERNERYDQPAGNLKETT